MATKTHTSFLATLIVAGVVAAAAMVLGDGWGEQSNPIRYDTEEYVVFSARFTPSPNDRGVHIIVTIEGQEVINYLGSRSPWDHGQWIPKGAEVSMIAQQSTPDMVMCQITSNKRLVASNTKKGELGSARCWHNRQSR